jgi:Flp pilus assembly pilin Flp
MLTLNVRFLVTVITSLLHSCKSEEGASLIEDLLIVGVVVIPLAALGYACVLGLRAYFETLAALVTMPFP